MHILVQEPCFLHTTINNFLFFKKMVLHLLLEASSVKTMVNILLSKEARIPDHNHYTSLGSEDFNVFETESAVQGLSGVSDGGCALSLLSSQSQNSSSQSTGIPMPGHLVIPSSHSHYSMSHVSESGVSDRFPSELNHTDGSHLSPILISNSNEIAHFQMVDGVFQGSDFVNVKDCLSCEDGTTIDLLQLSSQLQHVEHQRRALQVKRENDSSCFLRIT
jgi:hypothetical protein